MTQHPTPNPPPQSGRGVAAELPKRRPPASGRRVAADDPALRYQLDALTAERDHWRDRAQQLAAVAAGLEPEQEIRADALAAAARLAAVGKLAATDDLEDLLDFADQLADYVRTGDRP